MRRRFALDTIVVEPAERRGAVLRLIRSARTRLALSLFRFGDREVLDALARARRRGVVVEAIVTSRGKRGRNALGPWRERLEAAGVVLHRYVDPKVKYHAKFCLADTSEAIVTSLNLTRKCFERTCDFLVATRDPAVIRGVAALFEADRNGSGKAARGLSEAINGRSRLILGPDRTRDRFTAVLRTARKSVRIVDHKVTDPAIRELLHQKTREGIEVTIIGRDDLASLAPHGKLLIVDGRVAIAGSVAMKPACLDTRRELAIQIEEPGAVKLLEDHFVALQRGSLSPAFAGPPAERVTR